MARLQAPEPAKKRRVFCVFVPVIPGTSGQQCPNVATKGFLSGLGERDRFVHSMPPVGFAPTLPFGNQILSLARLLIPPRWLVFFFYRLGRPSATTFQEYKLVGIMRVRIAVLAA